MTKTKTKTKTAKKNLLVTTSTRVGKQEFRVTIRRIGESFRIVATVVRLPGKWKRGPGPSIPLIMWSCPFTQNEADALVWSLAFELGYEVDEVGAIQDHPLFLLKARDGLFDLRLYRNPHTPEAGVVVSRAGAQQILEALAKRLHWKLTG